MTESRRCEYLGCFAPATHGVERAYMGTGLYCLAHVESIARSKSAARTLRRVFSLAEQPDERLPRPHGHQRR